MAKATYTVQERLLTTADGRVVKSGDPDGVRLLFSPGKVIPLATARRLGLNGAGTGESVGTKVKRWISGPPRDKSLEA